MACLTPYVPQRAFFDDTRFPCGKCYNCRLRRCSQWVFRLKQEIRVHALPAFFVTLTYGRENADRSNNNFLTLNKKHVQLYFKQLRTDLDRAGIKHRIKYFVAGEYGGRRGRPHYHIILFGASEKFIGAAWRHEGRSRGFVDIRPLNYGRIGYTLKYILKGRTVGIHARDDRQPEFQLRSLGLGANYLTREMIDYHRWDLDRTFVKDGKFKVAMPRYYRDRIYNEADREVQRERAIVRMRESLDRDRRDYLERNGTLQNYFESKESQRAELAAKGFIKAQKTRMRL